MISRRLVGFVGLFVGSLSFAQSAPESTGERARVAEQALQQMETIQLHLEFLNDKYDQLFTNVERVRKFLVSPTLVFPQTQADREMKSVVGQIEARLKGFEQELTASSAAYGAAVANAPTLWSSDFPGERFRGEPVASNVTLFQGPRIRKHKPGKLSDPKAAIGDLGQKVREVCAYEKETDFTDGTDLFLNIHFPTVTCAFQAKTELLDDPSDSLNAKIELLTGSKIPANSLDKPDPSYLVDLSNAPKLDAIIMNYLEFKNDFSGQMMAQIFRYHADRGTQIRVMVPGLPIPGTNFVHGEDQALIDELTKYSPNIQFKKYTFWEKNPDLIGPFNTIMRAFHAKILVAISSATPDKSGVIMGGRNIKDTFYFKERPDYSAYPKMVQYAASGPSVYGFFRDLEMRVTSHEFAQQVAAQAMSFWQLDRMGPRYQRVTAHLQTPIDPARTQAYIDYARSHSLVRAFYSVPYIDDEGKGGAVEQIYVAMLNAARKKVRIVSAYVSPTSKVARAIQDATKRGVEVSFVTGFDFSQDNSPGFTGDMNKIGFASLADTAEANSMRKNLKLYAWEEKDPNSILHSKAMLVDDDLLYVGSANMDKRTFKQDVESGLLVTGDSTQAFKRLYDGFYLKHSRLITEKIQKGNLLNRLIIFMLRQLDLN